MTPEAQRIAIAEACGWRDCKRATNIARTIGTTVVGTNDRLQQTSREWKYDAVPDYLNDLNAMHEAEKVLTDNQHYDYTGRLEKTVDGFCAPAAQRCEAFLKTLGLWTE